VQFECLSFYYNSVACIIASLISYNKISFLCKKVNYLPFSFVAPLGANNKSAWNKYPSIISKEKFLKLIPDLKTKESGELK